MRSDTGEVVVRTGNDGALDARCLNQGHDRADRSLACLRSRRDIDDGLRLPPRGGEERNRQIPPRPQAVALKCRTAIGIDGELDPGSHATAYLVACRECR